MEINGDEMLARAFQESLQMHEEHQQSLDDAVMSQLEVEDRILRESEAAAAAAAARRARQDDEEEELRLILERSVADEKEARIRRRVAELAERARLDRLFGSGSRLGMDLASRSLAQVGVRGSCVLRDDSPLYTEPDEDESIGGGHRRTSVLRPTYPRHQSGTPSVLGPRGDRALIRVLNSTPRLPAVAISRYNSLPLPRQIRSPRIALEPAQARGHNPSARGRRCHTTPTTTTTASSSSSSSSSRTSRRVNRSPLPSITSYSLDEVLARSRRDAFPTGPYTAAVEDLNDTELHAAINESAGGQCRDEEEEAIQRNRGIPTYEEACKMNIYGAPRGRRYVFQGPSSVSCDGGGGGEGGGEVKWEIVGDMDLREAVRVANKNVDRWGREEGG
ncbi:hypothetical protein EMCG_05446 [[Emmonsia] crescens]|uniref:Uncharacterized protein n=1 Tax=[Emmonsia] crescens TaxID=73230 RepID=A0A0G2HNX4_9EURO|nr:hypothetical protein EMCG_05446 [Emmonsia crescens UAMH 3008]